MKVHRLPRYRVAIPLSSRCMHVVSATPEQAVRVALEESGMLEGREITKTKEGVNWTFYRINPPLPASWMGDCDVPVSVVNPKQGVVSLVEAECQGTMLVSLPEQGVQDE